MSSINKLVDYLFYYPRAWVLSGAGISTESGIPDFRSPGGMWDRVDPMENFSVWALYNNPTGFFTHGLDMFKVVAEAVPNKAHEVIGELQQKRILGPVVTQNVDSLHQKGGAFWVYEVHGHFRTATCMECHQTQVTMDELIARAKEGEIPPVCECGGILKPDVILFGDAMPHDYVNSLGMLHSYNTTDNLIIVIGSSLVVSPINTLPHEFSHLAIINNTSTPMDREADIIITGSAGDTMQRVYQELLALNAGKNLETLPAGFIPGRLLQICEDNLKSISRQSKSPGFKRTTQSKAVKLYYDLNLLEQLFNQYPQLGQRQELERSLIKRYADRIRDIKQELGKTAAGNEHKLQKDINGGYLIKSLADICEGHFKAIGRYLREDNWNKEVLTELVKQFSGTVGLYKYILNIAEKQDNQLLRLEDMLEQTGIIVSQRDLPVNIEIALQDF